MCFIISCICVYYYDYLYVCYMLDIGERAIELMFFVYCHTDENKDYLSIYLCERGISRANYIICNSNFQFID